MNIQIKKRWFSEPRRHSLSSFVQEQTNENAVRMTDFSLYDQPTEEYSYKVSVLCAWQVVLQLIQYIGVDPTNKRPWLAHRKIKEPLELNQFKGYIDEVVQRLTSRPPNVNYPALVHIHTVINLLTIMEYQDGR